MPKCLDREPEWEWVDSESGGIRVDPKNRNPGMKCWAHEAEIDSVLNSLQLYFHIRIFFPEIYLNGLNLPNQVKNHEWGSLVCVFLSQLEFYLHRTVFSSNLRVNKA